MWRRSTRIAVECIIGVIAGVALLMGVAIWRLAQEPLRLNFLTPYLEEALASEDGGLGVEVGETVLIWADWSRTLDIRVREVRLRDPKGYTIARLPDASVNLSLRALMHGVIAPTAIEVIGAQLTLVRWADGRFDFGVEGSAPETDGPSDEPEADLSLLVPRLLKEVVSQPNPEQPLSFLKVVRVLDGSLTMIDRKLLTVWRAPSATIEVKRTVAGLSGGMYLTLSMGERNAALDLTFDYDKTSDLTNLVANFADLRFEALAQLLPAIAPAAAVQAPLDGTVTGVLGSDGRIQSLGFDLNGREGSLVLPELLPEPRALRGLQLRGRMDGNLERLEIDVAALHFAAVTRIGHSPGPSLVASGTVEVRNGDLLAEVSGRVTELPVDDLTLYWPEDLSRNARIWVDANVRRGLIEDAEITASLRVPGGDLELAEVEALSGGYRYSDFEVHYMPPMPPVTGVLGTATFDLSRMIFHAAAVGPGAGRTSGGADTLGDLRISEATIKIFDLDKVDQNIDIDLKVDGSISDALGVLDHESLRLVSELGIDPKDTSGKATARVRFRFPLLSDVTFDQVTVTAEAELMDAGVHDVLFGQAAQNGQLKVILDKDGMAVSGPIQLGSVPVRLDWRESFGDTDGPSSIFDIEIDHIDEIDLSEFGFVVTPYITGPLTVSLLVTLDRDHSGTMDAHIDLTNAWLSVPTLLWRKEPGVAAEMKISIRLLDDKMAGLETIDVKAGTLSARGQGRFDETGKDLGWLELDELSFGNTRLSQVTVARAGEAIDATVGSGVFDAKPFMERVGTAESVEGGEVSEPLPVFRFSAPYLESVYFAEDRYLENVSLELERDAEGWQLISVSARVPRALWTGADEENDDGATGRKEIAGTNENGQDGVSADAHSVTPADEERTLGMHYRAVAPNDYRLDMKADDVGAVLRALDVRDTIKGGRMRITGQSDGPIPGHTLNGRIEVDDFTLVGAPTLASVLTVASLTGLVDTLSGNGIWFEKLTSDFTLTDGLVETDFLHIYGPAIGITAKGHVSMDETQVDLEGTVVPAYTVNRILGAIPGLNLLLVGGEGEGLFAFTYSLKGSLADPEASVNPLSALAPGFLRKLFGAFDGNEEPTVFPEGPDR